MIIQPSLPLPRIFYYLNPWSTFFFLPPITLGIDPKKGIFLGIKYCLQGY
jgi:hypothetical protein